MKEITFDENLVGKKVVSKLNPKEETHEVVNFFVYKKCKYITLAYVFEAKNRPYEYFHKFAMLTESEFNQNYEVMD